MYPLIPTQPSDATVLGLFSVPVVQPTGVPSAPGSSIYSSGVSIGSTPLSSVEVKLTFGGDFEINALGDLVLVQDTLTSPAATIQRMIQLILTNPRLKDTNGNFIGRADDLFNPDYGAGVDQKIGELGTAGVLADLQARVLAGIALDPGIAAFPAPVVTATSPSPGTALIDVAVTTVTGQYVPVPTQTLQIFS